MSTTTDATIAAERVARASIAFGRKRGYYRVLFEAGPVDAATFAALAGVPERSARAWLDEQVAAGLLRVVAAPSGDHDELMLPGEYVPILLGDHGEAELEGARALLAELLAEHRGELPHVLESMREPAAGIHHSRDERAGAFVELEQVRAFADAARITRLV